MVVFADAHGCGIWPARKQIAVSTRYATTIDNTFARQPALGSLMVRKARVSGVKLSAISARIRRGSLAEVVDVGSS